MVGSLDRFNIFTRFCCGAIYAQYLVDTRNCNSNFNEDGNHRRGYHQSCMRSRNMTNEQKKRDLLREMWVTNDIHDHFLRPFVEKYF